MTSEQRAYKAIKSRILAGEFKPGGHLPAADLAKAIGVSRTPVREAVRRLHAEGLVDFFANRGAFVADRSAKDVDEVFDLRVVLEGHAAALAARHLTPDQIEALKGWTNDMEQAAADRLRDPATLAEANELFHSTIIAAAANSRLATMIASVVQISWVARTFGIYSDQDLAASILHHREMVRAFEARDPVWAGAVMSSHIKAAHHVFKAAAKAGARP